ncbi:MAG: DUF2254 domain-containing protein [Rhodobacteraceae bacterium]|nr:DUF2254 domain-containing protein [Paracoccaceae bacterium]
MLAGRISKLFNFLMTDHGFITVPGILALLIWLSSALTLGLDRAHVIQDISSIVLKNWLPYQTALSVLGTVAGAAITTLSLVYSLVLVVFTLAAGTIAPRLLRRFTNDRVSQLTAGLLGGTFLFTLTVLSTTSPDFVPRLSTAVSIVLAALSVLQLIYFVHSVSVSVMIDQEIADIGEQLKVKIKQIVLEDEASERTKWPEEESFDRTLHSPKSGFLSLHDPGALVAFAQQRDFLIELSASPGEFITEGEELARFTVPKVSNEEEGEDDLELKICDCLQLSAVGEDYRGVVFSTNLLLEIALRALSPGVNDTFTAMSCVSRLSECLTLPVSRGIRENIQLDSDGDPRLCVPGLTLEDLLHKTFQPIRQAAASNHLMLVNLANVFTRLHALAQNKRVRELIEDQAHNLIGSYKQSKPLPQDLRDLEKHLKTVIKIKQATETQKEEA